MKKPTRCSAVENGRKCTRNGSGRPSLCRAHELALQNPFDDVMDRFDEITQKGTDNLMRGVTNLFERFAERITTPTPREWVPYTPPRAREASPPRQPPPPSPKVPQEDPREVMGFSPEAKLTKALIKERFKTLSQIHHPDKGGSIRGMQKLNAACKALLTSVS